MVIGVQRQVLVALILIDAVVGIARRQEVLAVGLRLTVKVCVRHLYAAVSLPHAVAVFHAVVYARLLLGQHTTVLQALWVPTAAFTWFSVAVQIVGRGVGSEAGMVRKAKGKETSQPSVFCTTANLRIP